MQYQIEATLDSEEGRARVAGFVCEWICSEGLRSLVAAEGWAWPEGETLEATVEHLARLTEAWDFRRGRERVQLGDAASSLPDETVHAAAQALGLLSSERALHSRYDHILVPGGTAFSSFRRVALVRDLLDAGVQTSGIWLLGAMRNIRPEERESFGGLPHRLLSNVSTEFDALGAAAREYLDLVGGSDCAISDGNDSHWDAIYSAPSPLGPTVAVVAAASSAPGARASTRDNYRSFIASADPEAGSRILICTTQIYAPYQFFTAVMTLCRARALDLELIGAGAETGTGSLFRPANYLQEVRSGVLGAQALLRSLAGTADA